MEINVDNLRFFYDRIFPFTLLHRWLNYSHDGEEFFPRREFSMTVTWSKSNEEGYMRYRSYRNADEWKREVVKLNPSKIDIGAIYNIPVDKKDTIQKFQPVEREFVLDIDMSDYDSIRSCCTGSNICPECWRFMALAQRVLHEALTQDFDAKNLLWVFSGRRGVHCWIGDERFRKGTNDVRSSIADYLNIITGGDNNTKKVSLDRSARGDRINDRTTDRALSYLPPIILRTYDIIIKHYWDSLSSVQKFFDKENPKNHITLVYDYLLANGEKQVHQALSLWVEKTPHFSSTEFWQQLVQRGAMKKTLMEIVLSLTYPRIDIHVSKGMNHLLKSPFCVHPKTSRVCVPIAIEDVDVFNPLSSPMLSDVCEEYNAKGGDIKQTSLQPYLQLLKKFAHALHLQKLSTQQPNVLFN